MSSATESVFALESDSPHRIRFDLDRVLRTQYRIDGFKKFTFVLPDLADLLNLARIDFKPHQNGCVGHQAICQVLSSRAIKC